MVNRHIHRVIKTISQKKHKSLSHVFLSREQRQISADKISRQETSDTILQYAQCKKLSTRLLLAVSKTVKQFGVEAKMISPCFP